MGLTAYAGIIYDILSAYSRENLYYNRVHIGSIGKISVL